MDKYKYEVAISCLKDDEPVARELYELLRRRVQALFLYTQNQKDAIGEDGVEWFKGVYRSEARIVAVIYREGWGLTKWTGVEDRAIQDLYLNHGWRRILVYSVDGKAPSWLPDNYLWGGKIWGLTAFAAAIERKIHEEGGHVGEEDVVAMAQRIQGERAAAEAREARRFTPEAVHAAHHERMAIYSRLEEMVTTLNSSQPNAFYVATISGLRTVSTPNVSVGLLWNGNCANSIRGDTLTLHVARNRLGISGWEEQNSYVLGTYELYPAADSAAWRWVDVKTEVQYSSAELAERALRILIEEDEKRRGHGLQRSQRGR